MYILGYTGFMVECLGERGMLNILHEPKHPNLRNYRIIVLKRSCTAFMSTVVTNYVGMFMD